MYLAPVFTALEYAVFEAFGVGQWQARTVSAGMGLLAVLAVGFGAAACGTRRTGLTAAALLASNYVWVQWNRAALMEATMVAFIAISWSAYALAERRAWWGAVAGVAAVLAFFTKAAAAFYVGALGLEVRSSHRRPARALGTASGCAAGATASARRSPAPASRRRSGRSAASPLPAACSWCSSSFRTGASSGSTTGRCRSPASRRTAPARSWTGCPGCRSSTTSSPACGSSRCSRSRAGSGLLARWREASGAERLLGLSAALGVAELIVHDVGNERRLIFLIPAARRHGGAGADARRPAAAARRRTPVPPPRAGRAPARPVRRVRRLRIHRAPRVSLRSPARASGSGPAPPSSRRSALYASWPAAAAWLARERLTWRAAALVIVVLVAGDLAQFGQWAASRTYKNVEASRLVGEWLPPGTLVQGKLANGLALENRIRPVFVGRGFGNYDDRLQRDDVRYLLTYVYPSDRL